MKRIAIYIALLAAALLMPVNGTDVGKLVPVEVLQLYKDGDAVVISTDLGNTGTGTTVETAIENLKNTTAGIIFLDTADFLLVDETAQEEAGALKSYLKPSARVCRTAGVIELKEAASYLAVHKPRQKLKTYEYASVTQILTKENDRMLLKEK